MRNVCCYPGGCSEALQVKHQHFLEISKYKLPPLIVISLIPVFSSDSLSHFCFCSSAVCETPVIISIDDTEEITRLYSIETCVKRCVN